MIFAPLEGWRRVEVTDHHAAVDYAKVLKELSDVDFPAAKKIVLVQDNLNTHRPTSLYAAFPAPEARRLVNRFEWHYTPPHGSWLDMAEYELAVLTTQCLSRRARIRNDQRLVVSRRHKRIVDRGRLIEGVARIAVGGVAALRAPMRVKGQLMRMHGDDMARRGLSV